MITHDFSLILSLDFLGISPFISFMDIAAHVSNLQICFDHMCMMCHDSNDKFSSSHALA